jgi:dCTP deaminase
MTDMLTITDYSAWYTTAPPLGLLSDRWIRKLSIERGMIAPFVDYGDRIPDTISFGLTSYGYDIRLAEEWKILNPEFTGPLDVKRVNPAHFVALTGPTFIVQPHGFVLARSVEYFKIPRNMLCLVLGKSTYARAGIVTNFTPLEPEWEGFITIEISNTTGAPVVLYANEGIAQVTFENCMPCERSYAQKRGKYQGQQGITLSMV